MLNLKKLVVSSVIGATLVGWAAPAAQAGPLLDWLLGKHRCGSGCTSCLAPAQACAPACPQPQVCSTTCNQTCSRVVVNYVPYTAYRAAWEQVPVTQYQRTCSTDPCTGCTVTCMRPCTSYTWRMKQVPYTTYRPVYRTETYSVPITYTAMAASPCAPCNTCPTYPAAVAPQAGCATCGPSGTSYAAPVVSGMPAILPQGTLSTNGTYTVAPSGLDAAPYYQNNSIQSVPQSGTPTPADQVPSLGQPIIIDRREITPQSSVLQPPPLTPTNTGLQGVRPIRDPNPGLRWDNQAPPTDLEGLTASALTRRSFDYSPIRLASYIQVVADPAPAVAPSYRGTLRVEGQAPATNVNSAWKNAD